MAALWNKRRERFCQLIASGLARDIGAAGMTQHAAYQAAGYAAQGASARVCAHRLLTQANEVIQRVKELQRQHATRKAVTVDTISDELDEARIVAKANDQASAMVAASGTKAKLYGLFIDRVEQGKAGDFTSAKDTADLADMRLREANPNVVITQDMRDMALQCIAGHAAQEARELAAIASGTMPAIEPKPRLSKAKSLKTQDISAQH